VFVERKNVKNLIQKMWPNMVRQPAIAHKCIKVSHIISTVFLLLVSVTLVSILREVHYK